MTCPVCASPADDHSDPAAQTCELTASDAAWAAERAKTDPTLGDRIAAHQQTMADARAHAQSVADASREARLAGRAIPTDEELELAKAIRLAHADSVEAVHWRSVASVITDRSLASGYLAKAALLDKRAGETLQAGVV